MILRLTIALVLVAVALGLAWLLNRRKPAGPVPARSRAHVPGQIDRADFSRPEAPWIVVLFSSESCGGCAPVAERISVLEDREVAVCEVEWGRRRDLHERYQIDGVPVVVVADARGVVRTSFVGATAADDLWNAVAELRASG